MAKKTAVLSSEIKWTPKNYVFLPKEKKKQLTSLLAELKEWEETENVQHNAKNSSRPSVS